MSKWPLIEPDLKNLDKIENWLECKALQLNDLQRHLDELERLGVVEAKPHWRDGKYLYLIYPMKDGERKREYIGADQDKIDDALAKIGRVQERDKLQDEIAQLQSNLSTVRQYIVHIMGLCRW